MPLLAQAGLPQSSSVPGGVAVIPLSSLTASASQPQAWLGEQPILVTAEANRWFAVVGLALDTPVGSHELRVRTGEDRKSVV